MWYIGFGMIGMLVLDLWIVESIREDGGSVL